MNAIQNVKIKTQNYNVNIKNWGKIIAAES